MNLLEIALIAVALGCDAFAVGMGVGARFCNARQIFRLSFHFGLFQFMMPLLGWFMGQNLVGVASRWAPWIAFVLLFAIGAKMAGESYFHKDSGEPVQCADPTRGGRLVVLSLATSIDALGVGFSMGLMGSGLIFPAVWIGITAGMMTWGAMRLGNRLSEKFGRWMEVAGGCILMAIAVKLLL
ncbi:MAG: manganese efflux pump MntP family protein [Desulfobacteraceae bacterium]|nr:manganese efflux pump MntP family protein [Desulfobacteraceae bacterium]